MLVKWIFHLLNAPPLLFFGLTRGNCMVNKAIGVIPQQLSLIGRYTYLKKFTGRRRYENLQVEFKVSKSFASSPLKKYQYLLLNVRE